MSRSTLPISLLLLLPYLGLFLALCLAAVSCELTLESDSGRYVVLARLDGTDPQLQQPALEVERIKLGAENRLAIKVGPTRPSKSRSMPG